MAGYKPGFHAGVGGNRQGIGEHYLRRLDGAGLPFSLKSTNDVGLAVEGANLARVSRIPHNIIMRFTNPGAGGQHDIPDYRLEPGQSAANFWSRVRWNLDKAPELGVVRDFIWLELVNEPRTQPDPGDPNFGNMHPVDWLGAFGLALAKRALNEGWRVALFGMNAGTPEPNDWVRPNMVDLLRYASTRQESLAISLHEGKMEGSGRDFRDPISVFRPWWIGRFTFLIQACQSLGIAPPTIFISEWAWRYNDMPDLQTALRDTKDLADLLVQHDSVRGAYLWNLAGGPQWADLPNKLQRLIQPLGEQAVTYQPPSPPPPPPPPPAPDRPRRLRHRLNLVPQDTTLAELQALAEHTHALKQAFTYSHDVADAVAAVTTQGGEVIIWDKQRWPGLDLDEFFRLWPTVTVVHRRFSELAPQPPPPPPTPVPPPPVLPGAYRWQVWPTIDKRCTQGFGANPQNYAQFGLPGHDGLDFAGPLGSVVVNVTPGGVVTQLRQASDGNPLGNAVFVQAVHESKTYQTVYAHLQSVSVQLGQTLQAGQQVGFLGSTGNSTGPHLHIQVRQISPQAGEIGWPLGIINPTRFAWPLAPGGFAPFVFDVLPYIQGDGRAYMLQTENGPQEKTRRVLRGGNPLSWQTVKNTQWEGFSADTLYLYRDVDTSPGNNQYYRLFDPWAGRNDKSAWAPRYFAVTQVFERLPTVSFHWKANCQLISQSGNVRSYLVLTKWHNSFTFFTGKSLNDVLVMEWRLQPNSPMLERYYYARGFGLVGWDSSSGRRSAFADTAVGDNLPEIINCL